MKPLLGWLFPLLAVGLSWQDPSSPNVTGSEPASELQPHFARTEGWLGADGSFSIDLGGGKTLWLYGDTFVGKLQEGRRTGCTMVNGSAAISEGRGRDFKIRFFVKQDAAGKPTALIHPADGKGWFWQFHGWRHADRLYLFLAQMEKTSATSVFGFRQIGLWLGVVLNPDAEPTAWKVEQVRLPFCQFTPKRNQSFGTAVLKEGDFAYLYGFDEDVTPFGPARHLCVARVPLAQGADPARWEFFDGQGWTKDAAKCHRHFSGMATEASVTRVEGHGPFLLTYTENGMSQRILARSAERPWGPWSAPTVLYTCPEVAWDKRIFTYAGKAHPTLAGEGELIVSYAANSMDFWHVCTDARLYWPKFVRVRLGQGAAGPVPQRSHLAAGRTAATHGVEKSCSRR